MKKICLIGNSHLGCIKRAWDKTQKSEYPCYSFDYFLAAGDWIKYLQVTPTLIAPKLKKVENSVLKLLKIASGKQETSINIRDYDIFFIGGLGFKSFFPVMGSYRDIRFNMNETKHFISQEFFQELYTSYYRNHYIHKLIKNIRKQTNAEIIFISDPCPTKNWFKFRKFDHFLQPESDFMNNLFIQYCALNKQLCALNNAHFLTQPESTFEIPGFTIEHFNNKTIGHRGKVRGRSIIRYKSVDRDGSHMNTEYGELLIMDVLSYLENLPTMALCENL